MSANNKNVPASSNGDSEVFRGITRMTTDLHALRQSPEALVGFRKTNGEMMKATLALVLARGGDEALREDLQELVRSFPGYSLEYAAPPTVEQKDADIVPIRLEEQLPHENRAESTVDDIPSSPKTAHALTFIDGSYIEMGGGHSAFS